MTHSDFRVKASVVTVSITVASLMQGMKKEEAIDKGLELGRLELKIPDVTDADLPDVDKELWEKVIQYKLKELKVEGASGWTWPQDIAEINDEVMETKWWKLMKMVEEEMMAEFNDYTSMEFDQLPLNTSIGYVYTCLGAALWSFRQEDQNWKQSINRIIHAGGDADTNATVAGALWGAWLGAKGLKKNYPNFDDEFNLLVHKDRLKNEIQDIESYNRSVFPIPS